MKLEQAIDIILEYAEDCSDEYTNYCQALINLYEYAKSAGMTVKEDVYFKATVDEIIEQGKFIEANTEIVETTIPAVPARIEKRREWI